jgi:hypothetical protein
MPRYLRLLNVMTVVLGTFLLSLFAFSQTTRFQMDGPLPAKGPAELIAKAPVIVEVTVQSVFPAEIAPYGLNGRLQTDVVLRVDRIMKGANIVQQAVVSQWGGTVQGRSDLPVQYSIMQPNERYVVMLSPISGSSNSSRAGIPRYDLWGAFFGLIRLDGDNLGFSAGVPKGWQSVFGGMGTSGMIIEAVNAMIGQKQ